MGDGYGRVWLATQGHGRTAKRYRRRSRGWLHRTIKTRPRCAWCRHTVGWGGAGVGAHQGAICSDTLARCGRQITSSGVRASSAVWHAGVSHDDDGDGAATVHAETRLPNRRSSPHASRTVNRQRRTTARPPKASTAVRTIVYGEEYRPSRVSVLGATVTRLPSTRASSGRVSTPAPSNPTSYRISVMPPRASTRRVDASGSDADVYLRVRERGAAAQARSRGWENES